MWRPRDAASADLLAPIERFDNSKHCHSTIRDLCTVAFGDHAALTLEIVREPPPPAKLSQKLED